MTGNRFPVARPRPKSAVFCVCGYADGMNPLTTFLDLYRDHKWAAIAVIVIGYLVRLFSSDTKFPVTVPDRWKPVLVIVLGQAYACAQMISNGTKWQSAVLQGIFIAFTAMGLFDIITKAIWNNRPEPRWMQMLALVEKNVEAVVVTEIKPPLDADQVAALVKAELKKATENPTAPQAAFVERAREETPVAVVTVKDVAEKS